MGDTDDSTTGSSESCEDQRWYRFHCCRRHGITRSSVFRSFTRSYVGNRDVPQLYQEKYITSGYRHPYSSVTDCIVSAFRLNNETINIWTHFIPLVFLVRHFYTTFPSPLFPLWSIPTQYYPLLTLELSVCAYLLGSTLAHTFNCMSPRIRHICFYMDYVAISTFGIGGACSSFYYLRPINTGFFLFVYPNVYMCGSTICTVVATYFAISSRHQWDSSKYIVRTLSFAASYMYGNFPSFVRLLLCLLDAGDCSYSLVYVVVGWLSYLICAFLNTTRFPESRYPRTFDLIGHNHQWLHLITTLGTLCLYWAVQEDLEVRSDEMPILLSRLNGYSSLGWLLLTFCLTSAIALWFGCRLRADGSLGSDEQKEQ